MKVKPEKSFLFSNSFTIERDQTETASMSEMVATGLHYSLLSCTKTTSSRWPCAACSSLHSLRQTNLSSHRGLGLTELWLSSTAGRFHFHLISASALMLLALHQRPFVPVSPPSHTVSHQEAAGSWLLSFSPLLCFPILLSFLPFVPSLSLYLSSLATILSGWSQFPSSCQFHCHGFVFGWWMRSHQDKIYSPKTHGWQDGIYHIGFILSF